MCHEFFKNVTNKQQEPPAKTRKVASPSPSKNAAPPSSRRKSAGARPPPAKRDSTVVPFQSELVDKVEDLQSDERQRAANALVKLFSDETKKAEKEGSFNLPESQSINEFGRKLGLSVEYALYLNYWGTGNKPSDQYSGQFRGILHNVKKNHQLRDQILVGSLSPNDLSKMSSADMASRELQDKKAELLKEVEKQSTLIQEEGPRIRRTHKGEELVDDQSQVADATHTAFAAPIRKRPSEIDTTMRAVSPEPISAVSNAPVELPLSLSGSPQLADSPPGNDHAAVQQSPGTDKASASKFDIQNVYSQIKSPDSEQRNRPIPLHPEAPPASVAQQADAEVDRLLKDEEAEEEEPYSPKEFTHEPSSGIVWAGSLGMPGVARFEGKAKHCAGADLSLSLSWKQLILPSLDVQGRINIEKASEYLCGLKWSTTTDLVIVSITPDTDKDRAPFDKLFNYFTERDRYGVVGKDPTLNPAIKDIYLIPLEAGPAKKPEFINLLEFCNLEENVPERMILLSLVVKLGNSPSQQTPRHPDVASLASPTGLVPNTTTSLGGHTSFQNGSQPKLPFNGAVYPQYAGSPLSNQPAYTPPQKIPQQSAYAPPPPSQHGPTGIDAARFVLGDWAASPAVVSLLAEAPKTTVQEFNVIKGLLEQNPAARNDYNVLKETMTRQYHSG